MTNSNDSMKNGSAVSIQVGTCRCTIVSDGWYDYAKPDELLFTNAARGELDEELAAHRIVPASWNSYRSPYPCLLVQSNATNVLVDTGAGNFGPSTGELIANLATLDMSPNDIDIVVLSHIHPDHAGGGFTPEGAPVFSKARHIVSLAEIEFWKANPDLSVLAAPIELQSALGDFGARTAKLLDGLAETVDAGTNITNEIKVLDAAGHTPGHIALQVTSDGESLIVMSDALVHPVHVGRPDWVTAVDFDPGETVKTRLRLMALATSLKAQVFAYHFPCPGFGRIRRSSDRFVWTMG